MKRKLYFNILQHGIRENVEKLLNIRIRKVQGAKATKKNEVTAKNVLNCKIEKKIKKME